MKKQGKLIVDYLRRRLTNKKAEKRKVKAVEGFAKSLHEEALDIANKELDKEMQHVNHLRNMLERVKQGYDLTPEETAEIKMVRISLKK